MKKMNKIFLRANTHKAHGFKIIRYKHRMLTITLETLNSKNSPWLLGLGK